MVFWKKQPRSCHYCCHCTRIDEETLLCVKRGFVTEEESCLKFRYDPCKRIPAKPKAVDFQKFNSEDYSL